MILLISGPPRSGKDTFYKFAKEFIPSVGHCKLSAPMKDMFRAVFQHYDPRAVESLLEEHKDNKLLPCSPATPRDFQIEMFHSLKQLFGSDILGQLGVTNLKNQMCKHIIVTDAGRNEEIKPILEAYQYGHVGIVDLTRPGTSFENDCREALDDSHHVQYRTTLRNEYDLELYKVQVKRLLIKWGIYSDNTE